MTTRQAYLLGLTTGAGLAAWVFPLTQMLTNAAAGRGLLYPKEDTP